MLEGSIEENKPEQVHVDVDKIDKEANLLRGDSFLEEGEWQKALHIYLDEGDKERISGAALKFLQEGRDEEYKIACDYLLLFDKKKDH